MVKWNVDTLIGKLMDSKNDLGGEKRNDTVVKFEIDKKDDERIIYLQVNVENDERKFLTLLENSVYSNENLNTQKGKTDYKPDIADHLREELRDKSEEHGTMRKITENYVIPIPLTIGDKEYSLKTIILCST